jgi:hypothetical protein
MMGGLRFSWVKIAVFVWAGLAVGFAAYAYLYPRAHTVYDIYAPAARKWWTGEDIYERGEEYYRYCPLFAAALSPLTFLPDCWGGMLWKTINLAAFALGLLAFARQVLPLRLGGNQVAALFLLVLPLSLHSAYIGQANLLMLGAVLLGLAAAARQRWNGAALGLAAATLIKGYPLALALLLAARYPRQFALRFVAALGLGLALPFALQSPEVVAAQYARWFAHLGDSTGILRERLRSIDHLLQVYGYPVAPQMFAALGLLSGAVVLLLAAWHARRTADPREGLTFTFLLFSVWTVLFGPATESCTYVVMAPAIAWALVETHQRPAWWTTRLLLIASLLLMGPLVTDAFGPVVRAFAIAHGSQPIGALLFFAYLLTRTGRNAGTGAAGKRPTAALRAAA